LPTQPMEVIVSRDYNAARMDILVISAPP
jgi:hypothetical protein